MFVRIKDFVIYVPLDTAITITVTSETKPEANAEDDHWEDERQQMLDDYD